MIWMRECLFALYVMKDKHIIEVLNDIVDYLPKYQEYIQQLKDQGYTMVGYCRKSKQTHENSNDRQRLLQQQVERLKVRSFVDKVFVSVYYKSSDPIVNRDLKNSSNVINELAGVDGDMQGNTITQVAEAKDEEVVQAL